MFLTHDAQQGKTEDNQVIDKTFPKPVKYQVRRKREGEEGEIGYFRLFITISSEIGYEIYFYSSRVMESSLW